MSENMNRTTSIWKSLAARSKDTLFSQWKDMLHLFAPEKAQPKTVEPDGNVVLELRVRMEEWPRGEGVLIRTRSQSFTVGNSSSFDICLNPQYEQAGDVYCAVFYDKKSHAFVAVQATGSFNIPIKDKSDPYRPGDWSLFVSGNRFQTVSRSTVVIPVSDADAPEYVLFNIGDAYFFEARAFVSDEAALFKDTESFVFSIPEEGEKDA